MIEQEFLLSKFISPGARIELVPIERVLHDDGTERKVYESKVWQLFMEAYGISDNVPYTHFSNLLENRGRLPEFKRGTRTFTNWVYDQVVDIIEKLSDKASVIICDSQLGSVWNNIEAKHFTYLYQKLQEKQITHINLSDLNASKQLVGKTIGSSFDINVTFKHIGGIFK